jgi:hypothetical protein
MIIQSAVQKNVITFVLMDTSVAVSVLEIVFVVSVNVHMFVSISDVPKNALKFVIDLPVMNLVKSY